MIGVGDAFWSMTMREFYYALDGYGMRQKNLRRLVFSAAIFLRNAWTKRNAKLSQVIKEGQKPDLLTAKAADDYFANENERLRINRERKEKLLARVIGYGS